MDQTKIPVDLYRGPAFDPTTGRRYEEFAISVTGGAFDLDNAGEYRLMIGFQLTKDGAVEWGDVRGKGTYEVDGDELVLIGNNEFDGETGMVDCDGRMGLRLDLLMTGSYRWYWFGR